MAMNESEFHSSLWASCDELRGGMGASQCVSDRSAIQQRLLKQRMMQAPLTEGTRLV
jgi:type I restriction-modification system DNA methylase subunit